MATLVERYLQKSFTRNYNCYDFVRDVWMELTSVDLGAQTPSTHNIQSYTEKAFQVANSLTKLETPRDPSIVLLQRSRLEPHIGIYLHGKVLHLTKTGAYYMNLGQVSTGYPNVSFYC